MPKKIPMRQCLGCREMKPKKELVRVVKTPDKTVTVDLRGKVSGRGAYVCRDPQCLQKAVKSKALERNLEIAIPPEIYEALAQQMEAEDAPC